MPQSEKQAKLKYRRWKTRNDPDLFMEKGRGGRDKRVRRKVSKEIIKEMILRKMRSEFNFYQLDEKLVEDKVH